MSEARRLRGIWADLDARRRGQLENAQRYAAEAEQVRATRDNPPNPLYTLEHQQEVDQRVQDLTRSADHSRAEAEKTLVEQRGLEISLREHQRTERRR